MQELDARLVKLAELVRRSECFVQEGVWATGTMIRIHSAHWLPQLEGILPFPIPAAYRHFLNTWEFLRFEAGGIDFFPNTPHEPDSLLRFVLLDQFLWPVLFKTRCFQIGRLDTGNYDPVCLRVASEEAPRDAAIVVLDHEEILMHEEAVITHELYPSFESFLGSVAGA